MDDKEKEKYHESVTNEPILTADEEQLVGSFFNHHSIEVSDNGFSHRVMRHLPQDSYLLNRIWTVICSVIGLLLLIFNNGWRAISGTFYGLWTDLSTSVAYQQNTIIIYLTLLGILMVGGYQLVKSEL